jgi:hypothetical protein
MECTCDEAIRNRKRRIPHVATLPPNQDGEIICAFCWDVLGRISR